MIAYAQHKTKQVHPKEAGAPAFSLLLRIETTPPDAIY